MLLDVEVLLEVMHLPLLRSDAEAAVAALVRAGRLDADAMRALLERRRLQHTLFRSLAGQALGGGGAAAAAAAAAASTGGGIARAAAPDGCEAPLGLAAALAASPEPALQQFAMQLHLHVFALWPSRSARACMLLSLVRAAAARRSPRDSAAAAAQPAARALLAITQQWPEYASTALICVLDLLARRVAAHDAAAAAAAAARADAAAAAERAARMQAALQEERARGAEAAAASERTVSARAEAAEAERAELRDANAALEDQVRHNVLSCL